MSWSIDCSSNYAIERGYTVENQAREMLASDAKYLEVVETIRLLSPVIFNGFSFGYMSEDRLAKLAFLDRQRMVIEQQALESFQTFIETGRDSAVSEEGFLPECSSDDDMDTSDEEPLSHSHSYMEDRPPELERTDNLREAFVLSEERFFDEGSLEMLVNFADLKKSWKDKSLFARRACKALVERLPKNQEGGNEAVRKIRQLFPKETPEVLADLLINGAFDRLVPNRNQGKQKEKLNKVFSNKCVLINYYI